MSCVAQWQYRAPEEVPPSLIRRHPVQPPQPSREEQAEKRVDQEVVHDGEKEGKEGIADL